MKIIPGETQTHEFIVPIPATLLSKAVISYKQMDYVTLEIETTTFETIDENSSKVIGDLSQSKSLQLRNIPYCEIQLNLFTTAGDRVVSDPILVAVGEQFHKAIIT